MFVAQLQEIKFYKNCGGQEYGAPKLADDYTYPTMEELAEQVVLYSYKNVFQFMTIVWLRIRHFVLS